MTAAEVEDVLPVDPSTRWPHHRRPGRRGIADYAYEELRGQALGPDESLTLLAEFARNTLTSRKSLPADGQGGTNGQHVYINGDRQKSVQVCGTNQRGDETCETFNTPEYSTADPNEWWWVGWVNIRGWAQPDGTGEYLGQVRCFVPKSQDGGNWVTCNTRW